MAGFVRLTMDHADAASNQRFTEIDSHISLILRRVLGSLILANGAVKIVERLGVELSLIGLQGYCQDGWDDVS